MPKKKKKKKIINMVLINLQKHMLQGRCKDRVKDFHAWAVNLRHQPKELQNK